MLELEPTKLNNFQHHSTLLQRQRRVQEEWRAEASVQLLSTNNFVHERVELCQNDSANDLRLDNREFCLL